MNIVILQRIRTLKAGVYRILIKFINDENGETIDEMERDYLKCRLESAANRSLREALKYFRQNHELDNAILDSDVLGRKKLIFKERV